MALSESETRPSVAPARPLPLHVRPDTWRPGLAQWIGLFAVALAAFTADQLSKVVIRQALAPNEAVELLGPLAIWHVRNDGIAFGVLGGRLLVVSLLTFLALTWMLVYFSRSGARHPLAPVALGLLLGGSLGNLVDRVAHGHVTDFIDVPWWPTFNFADIFICIGVGLLLLVVLGSERRDADGPVDITPRA